MLLLALALEAETAMATYLDKTRAERGCPIVRNSSDVTVCGLRTADRFRVPFVLPDAGNPLHEPVAKERQRYLARTDNCREKSLFLVGCGSFGLSATVGGGKQGVRVRPLAK
jgi:hypothetical protein